MYSSADYGDESSSDGDGCMVRWIKEINKTKMAQDRIDGVQIFKRRKRSPREKINASKEDNDSLPLFECDMRV